MGWIAWTRRSYDVFWFRLMIDDGGELGLFFHRGRKV